MKLRDLAGPAQRRAFRDEVANVAREPTLALWCLFLLFDPVYIFKSGLPQPADLLILLLAPMALAKWNGRLQARSLKTLRALFLFVGYVVASALVWSLITGSWTITAKEGFLMTPLFYVFDALVFLTVLVLYQRFGSRFVFLTVRVVLLSVVIQVVMTFIYTRGGTYRTYGLFNSSNQLGYYAILTSSTLLLGQVRARLSTIHLVAGLLCCSYLALLSASRAALGAAAILMMVAVLNKFRAVLVIAILAGFFMFVHNPFESAIERSRMRIANDQTLGFMEERGYDRVIAHPEYLLLGAGEGDYQRFKETSALGSHELHSSAGTLVFCYGVVGTAFFVAFILFVIRGSPIRRLLLLTPPAANALSHQGLRFTMFWVLLSLVVMLNDLDERDRAARRSGTTT